MVKSNNGFDIAEVDLKLRGPGDLSGTQQSGILNLKIANLVTDHSILKGARYAAQMLIEDDPSFLKNENQILAQHIQKYRKGRIEWGKIS